MWRKKLNFNFETTNLYIHLHLIDGRVNQEEGEEGERGGANQVVLLAKSFR